MTKLKFVPRIKLLLKKPIVHHDSHEEQNAAVKATAERLYCKPEGTMRRGKEGGSPILAKL